MKKRIKGEDVDILSAKDPKEYTTEKTQVFCIGSKGIPAKYGGFETFMMRLDITWQECQIVIIDSCITMQSVLM